jgi:hypothetical protein
VNELSPDLRAGCRRAQYLGALFVVSIAIYAEVLHMIAVQHGPFAGFAPSIDIGLIRILFAVVVVADFVVLRIVTPILLKNPSVRVPPIAGSSPVTQRLFTASIVGLAICETSAILGVALFLLGGRWSDFYGFAAVSLAGFVVYFPRLSRWEDRARDISRPA